ncbi:hypothetical protein BH10BDE1_BH10BDE1_05030 [soil metagenome]
MTTAIFNNPTRLSRSWYALMRSSRVKPGQARSVDFFDYKVALFRRQNGILSALYAYCPHMGADLGLGKVAGESLVCPYHKWAFGGSGQCARMAKKGLPNSATTTHSFPVVEKYGFIWIFNGESPYPFPNLPWSDDDHFVISMPASKVGCHPHVIGTNNPDFEHLETLHGFPIGEAPSQTSDGAHRLVYKYRIQLRPKNWLERFFLMISGNRFDFQVTQDGACTISMKIEAARYSLKTLISLTPTVQGTTVARFFLFIPRGGALARLTRFNLLRLPLILTSVLKVQMQDLAIYNNIRFKLPVYEPTMVRHAQLIESLGAFHPADASRTASAAPEALRDASSVNFPSI